MTAILLVPRWPFYRQMNNNASLTVYYNWLQADGNIWGTKIWRVWQCGQMEIPLKSQTAFERVFHLHFSGRLWPLHFLHRRYSNTDHSSYLCKCSFSYTAHDNISEVRWVLYKNLGEIVDLLLELLVPRLKENDHNLLGWAESSSTRGELHTPRPNQ